MTRAKRKEEPPQPGERIAMICPECNMREFGVPTWSCPRHGKAVRQANQRYFGRPTPGGH